MTLLVAGGDTVDAGKTTFATGLLARTGAVGFKPRAGNDYWYHHDDVRRAVGDGRLFGKDARRLAATSPGSLPPEAINPVHRLWRPTPGRTGILGQADRTFLCDRVGDRYVVNGAVEVPDFLRDNLPLADAVVVDSVSGLNEAMAQLHLEALGAVAEDIAAADRAVVESYGDVARPLQGVEPAAVAVVDPGRARIFDGSRYHKSCRMASGSPGEGRLEERVGNVVELLDPVATVRLPPLGDDDRRDPDAVADAYEPAYDRLLDVADAR